MMVTIPAELESVPRPQWPRHIAAIMDGNGRWAQQRGLPRIEGHRRGVGTVRRVTEACAELGLEALTLYCLSSENWKRPEHELRSLMFLLQQYLIEERRTLIEQNIQLRVIGRRDRLSAEVLAEMERSISLSAAHTGLKLVLAIDYGGRAEIVAATKKIAHDVVAGKLAIEQIDEARIADQLDTAGLPDPDLMIRTGGEMRVSNFLLWQLSYSELWVTQRYWPDFELSDLYQAIQDYALRDRRFGGLR